MIKNQWYIACFKEEVNKNKIVKRKICGEDIIIFSTSSGKVAAIEDRCCHRNVHLSLGRISKENIKCGYHGWEFDVNGKCVHIPMIESKEAIPKSACVKKYPLVLKHQAYWIFLGDVDIKNSRKIPDLSELDNSHFIYKSYLLDASLKLVAESLFDAQHINHVHRDSIKTLLGKLNEPKTNFNIETTSAHLKGSYERINNSSIFKKVYFGWNAYIQTKFEFWFPHTSKLASHFPKHFTFGKRELVIFEHFYEVEPNKVLMIEITTWKNIFKLMPWFAKWFMRQKSKKIVLEDIQFLESNLKWQQQKKVDDLIIKNDEPTITFLKLWNKNIKNEP